MLCNHIVRERLRAGGKSRRWYHERDAEFVRDVSGNWRALSPGQSRLFQFDLVVIFRHRKIRFAVYAPPQACLPVY